MREVLGQRLARVHCAIEAVYHRHNVSAILRTCDALGVHNVHLVEGHFTPAHGASRGAERWLDVRDHPTPEAAIAAIRAAGCRIYIADLSDDAVTPEQVPVDKPVCIWMGAELAGVSDTALAAADGVITIPMHGFAQSLNVSVAAALALRAVAERARAIGPDALLSEQERAATWAEWMERAENIDRGAAARASLHSE
ncbi:MAG: tRNA (guanosine-2'-O-)-methyltransferase [Myxococcota bacterium]|jgi:tRNA (guanosine-2'-O-)-methyltransferase